MKESLPHNFTGLLEEDSPGLLGTLKQLFEPHEVAEVSETYALAAYKGCVSDGPIPRAPGQSFNPRPARIAEILIKETAERNSKILCKAMLACDPEIFFPATPFSDDTELQRIQLAVTLDTVRHLHLMELSLQEKMRRLNWVNDSVLTTEVQRINQRLIDMLQNWARRFESNLSRS